MTYDLTSLAFLRDPAPQLSQMRSEASVVQVKIPILGKTWVTTSDTAARLVLKDNVRFIRNPKPITGKSLAEKYWMLPRFMKPLMDNIIGSDGSVVW